MTITVHDFVRCKGINDKPPSPNLCLLRATLANMKMAATHNHIGEDTDRSKDALSMVVAFTLDTITAYLNGRDIEDFHIDRLYPILREAISSLSTCCMCRRPNLDGLTAISAATVHKYESLRDYFADKLPNTDLARLFPIGTPSASQVQRICEALNMFLTDDTGHLSDDTLVSFGRDVLWVTPLTEKSESKRLLFKVRRARTADEIAQSGIAGRFRELLGLAHWPGNVHAIALTTRSLDVILRDECKVTAPTIFDAPCHIRFRHWNGSPPPDTGRTYDLNRSKRKDKSYGADELITSPLFPRAFSCVDYVGNVGRVNSTDDENEEYADNIAGDQSLEDLIKWLATTTS